VLANVDVGHTNPCLTLPIGGTAELSSQPGNGSLRILSH
jgi:muramoyltetrapeptide carboxypeptidase LdcA involved in peptidoglycan recycling